MTKKIIAVLFVLLIGALYTAYLTRDKQLDNYWKGAPNVTWRATQPPFGGKVDPAFSDDKINAIVDATEKAHPAEIRLVTRHYEAEKNDPSNRHITW